MRNLLKKYLLGNSYTDWKILPSLFLRSLMLLFLIFLIRNSCNSLLRMDLSVPMHWLLPVMALLLLHLPGSGNTVSVTAPPKGFMTAPAIVTFPSPTVISDGIHPAPAFIMVSIYTCWLLLIQKVAFLFFLC